MKSIKLTPSRVLASNDDDTGLVGIVRYEGGKIIATAKDGTLVYAGWDERKAAQAIVKYQNRMNRGLE